MRDSMGFILSSFTNGTKWASCGLWIGGWIMRSIAVGLQELESNTTSDLVID